jgi:hypothetical protein
MCGARLYSSISAGQHKKGLEHIKCPKEVVGASNMVLKVDIEMIENHLISTIDTIQVATMLE